MTETRCPAGLLTKNRCKTSSIFCWRYPSWAEKIHWNRAIPTRAIPYPNLVFRGHRGSHHFVHHLFTVDPRHWDLFMAFPVFDCFHAHVQGIRTQMTWTKIAGRVSCNYGSHNFWFTNQKTTLKSEICVFFCCVTDDPQGLGVRVTIISSKFKLSNARLYGNIRKYPQFYVWFDLFAMLYAVKGMTVYALSLTKTTVLLACPVSYNDDAC